MRCAHVAAAAIQFVRPMRKQQQLRRARYLASAILFAALVLLFVSTRYAAVSPWLEWVKAFAEAAAVGGIADWYAVVALFRRPLGLPIPHTAIIARNKGAIGDSLGEFVAGHLLTPQNIVAKLEHFDAAGQAAAWLAAPKNAERITLSVTGFVPGFLRAPDDADWRRFFVTHVEPLLLELHAAKIAGRLLDLLVGTGLHRAALIGGLQAFERWLSANEEMIRTKFAKASRFTPAPLDAYIVRKFLDGIRSLVQEVVADPLHPVRRQVDEALIEFIRELSESARYRDAARSWLRDLLGQYAGDAGVRAFREGLARTIETDLARGDSVIRRYVSTFLIALARGMLADPVVLARINGAGLRLVRSLAAEHRGEIALLIADVVKGWDANEVSRKVELAVGKDLQYIRINGALVGGLAGIILHACMLL